MTGDGYFLSFFCLLQLWISLFFQTFGVSERRWTFQKQTLAPAAPDETSRTAGIGRSFRISVTSVTDEICG